MLDVSILSCAMYSGPRVNVALAMSLWNNGLSRRPKMQSTRSVKEATNQDVSASDPWPTIVCLHIRLCKIFQ